MQVLEENNIIKVKRNAKINHDENMNKKFGNLTVINKIRYSRYVKYICVCDCGNKIEAYAQSVIKGATISCGCYHQSGKWRNPDKPRSDIKIGENRSTVNYLLSIYKRNAATRGHVFELDKHLFYELIQKNCVYCGSSPNQEVKFKKKKHTPSFLYTGLDRKINEIGYTEENVVPCCTMCNKAKGTLTENQFFKWLDNLVKFRTSNK